MYKVTFAFALLVTAQERAQVENDESTDTKVQK